MVLSDEAKQSIWEWLKTQGVSTVLLFTIVGISVWGFPYAFDRIDSQVQTVVNAYQEDQKRDEERAKRKDELIEKLIRRLGIDIEVASDP